MVHDSITEEIREIRHCLAAQFDNDVRRIGEELRRRQAVSGRVVVQLPSRIVHSVIDQSVSSDGEVTPI
ncbi:MAG: hypothetical protein K8T25_21790 [Planctomycetia bacterium]|nr:hypothetical protein [Planctomycetia bacterium]